MSEAYERIARLTPAQRAALLGKLGRHRASGIPRRPDRDGPAPLSFAQERFWLLSQIDPANSSYNVHAALRITGPLRTDLLGDCLDAIVARHDVLRTRFTVCDGEPVQIVQPEAHMDLPVMDLSDEDAPADQARRLAFDFAFEPFDLERAPLLRACLLRLAANEYVFVLAAHHSVFDAWSIGVLVRELSARYQGRRPEPAELPVQYADYAAWQRARLSGAGLEQLLDHWRTVLDGAELVVDVPTDRPRSARQSGQGARYPFRFPPRLRDDLRRVAGEEGGSLFMTLLAGFGVLLGRLAGSTDVVVGSPVAGRQHPDTEPLLGCFINTVLLRCDLTGEPTFREVLRRIKQTTLAAFDHQDLPVETLLTHLDARRGAAPFDVLFAFQSTPARPAVSDELTITPIRDYDDSANFMLGLECAEDEDGIAGSFEYMTDLFDEGTIAATAERLAALLTAAVTDPDGLIGDLPLSLPAELTASAEWNATTADYPQETIMDRITATADKVPDAIALSHGSEHLSYAELDRRTDRLAAWLSRQGCRRGDVVAVHLPRCLEFPVACLGVVKAGAVYLPIDPAYPAARVREMLAGVRMVITRGGGDFSVPSVDMTDLPGRSEALDVRLEPADAAYAIYTSGSTGKPKAAVNTHGGLINRLQWMQECLPLTARDCVLQKTPATFDVSVWELFWPLMVGARMHLAADGGEKDPAYIAEVIRAQGVTTMHFVPSMLGLFLDTPQASSCDSLRQVACSGEALSAGVAGRFAEMSTARLVNLYGPTEAAIDVTWWSYDPAGDLRSVPIGRPIANTRTYVLDRRLKPVPPGVSGELYIGGVALARGYLDRPGLTASRFVPSPVDIGERLYRTGDVVRRRADGVIEFVGRSDHQVKIRGVRVELGEVEARLLGHPGVTQAVATTRTRNGERSLVAYVVGSVEVNDVLTYLRGVLPDAFVPSQLFTVAELPLMSNGKIDRRALPDASGPAATAPPRTDLEHRLHDVWREVLGNGSFGIRDSFFAIGGTSLSAVRLVFRLDELLGIRMALNDVFTHDTIEAQARHTTAQPTQNTDLTSVIRTDSVLPADFIARDRPLAPLGARPILLTGATGFLGRHLLDELMSTYRTQVYCLVRGRDRLTPEGVRVIDGDLSAPDLGLSGELLAELAENVGAIIHNGAVVNSAFPYRALRAANVAGTAQLLDLAGKAGASFHQISTLSVYSGAEHGMTENEFPNDPGGLPNGYSQSKWAAEHLARAARERGLPVSIHRIGMITAHSRTGEGNPRDTVSRLIDACVRLRAAPIADVSVALAPVDWVAEAIVHLAGQGPGLDHHIASPWPTRWADLVTWLDAGVSWIPVAEWRQRLLDDAASGDTRSQLASAALFPLLADTGETGKGPDCGATLKRLGTVTCPEIDKAFVVRYRDFLAGESPELARRLTESGVALLDHLDG